jgi:hypothetical protein
LYHGVRIRKITGLSEEQEEKLILRADAIYAKHVGKAVTWSEEVHG